MARQEAPGDQEEEKKQAAEETKEPTQREKTVPIPEAELGDMN